MIKMIGSGSFGVTYVAKWHMAHVAMKVRETRFTLRGLLVDVLLLPRLG